ncbi:glycosyltransferase [Pseudomonas putida]|uniref:glycosyltransferase n=1 Tax=Pseudomonas putida TaxID=303 RepID=UPI0022650B4F|nr:glycosyltransferase [Pseudomonas putida]
MRVVFLGGVFTDTDRESIVSYSQGSIQFAADTLQKNYIRGFSECPEISGITVVNLPFIGAYPRRYKEMFYTPAVALEQMNGATVKNKSFFNLTIIKNLHKVMVAFRGIQDSLPKGGGERTLLVCYSMHLPFLLACRLIRAVRKDVDFCVIVPDLPEYMADRSGLTKLVFQGLARISYRIVNGADSVVAITDAMLDVFSPKLKKVVVEGIADSDYVNRPTSSVRKPYFLYSGTLDRRYGIRKLLDAFLASNVENYELYICGDGDDRANVESVSAANCRVKYLGQLDRNAVLKLQREATLLINPRDNESAFTKYSFPSKIIEYMSSGVPVMMYALDGIPKEYYRFCYLVPPGPEGLKEMMAKVASFDVDELSEMGLLAKKFVADHKMPSAQIAKVLDAIKGKTYV